jgi:hypothetical protein
VIIISIKSRRRWMKHVASMGKTYMVLVGKLDESRPLGRWMRRREDNNIMDFKDISWEDVE